MNVVIPTVSHRFFSGLFLASLLLACPGVRADDDADRKTLLTGVTALTAPGAIPGSLAVFGEHAFVVMTGKEGKSRVPMVAAATWGKGRLVAIGHEAFISRVPQDKENARFLENCLTWAGHGHPTPQTLRVGTFTPELLSILKSADADAVLLDADDKKDLKARLTNLDVLYLDQATLDGAKSAVQAVRAWIKQDGGGVVIAGPGWGWKQVTGKNLTTEQSATQISLDAGIAWANGMLDSTGPNDSYLADSEGVETAHGRVALERLTAHANGKAVLPVPQLMQATQVLATVIGALPTDDKLFAPRVSALCETYAGSVIPTHEKPITPQEPFARLKVVLQSQEEARLPVEKITANPAAQSFPGPIPADAPRIRRDVTVNTEQEGWVSTGLYAAPGEVVTVMIPLTWTGQHLAVRIGAHIDTLWHLEKWERWPDIARRTELTAERVRIASPFGGPIYIDVPEQVQHGSFTATIRNAVAAPLFVRGQTSKEEWLTARNAPAPWAELAGKWCTLTVPSSVVRTLDDPEELMTYWDSVMDACATLYAVPTSRRKLQRYVPDRQISAGYMHSGYPIMTWEDVEKPFVDINLLRGKEGIKTWGFYHELGHNHQRPEWTWEGCGEVTNNLFSLYGNEVFNGVTPDYTASHPAVRPDEREKRLQKYLAGGAKYEQWTSDPFLALTLFIELRQTFGWEPFTKVFAEYEALPGNQRPKTDIERRSQFMVRFSKAIGKNLGPFFSRWGVPTTEEAQQEIASLPTWMPSNLSAASVDK